MRIEYINENSFLKTQNNFIITKINKIYQKYFTYFNGLTKKEFDLLIEIIYFWYCYGKVFPIEKEDLEIFNSLKNKLLKKADLPSNLYRGLYFNNKKELDNFTRKIKKEGIRQYNPPSKKESSFDLIYFPTSWTSSLDMAKKFAGLGKFGADSGYSVILKLSKNKYMNFLIFTLTGMFKTRQDEVDFYIFVLEYAKNNLKKNKNAKIKKTKDIIEGSFYSLRENEYILKQIPQSEIDISKIIHKTINIKDFKSKKDNK